MLNPVAFSPRRWQLWCDRRDADGGSVIPYGLKLYAAWASHHDHSFALGPGMAESLRTARLGIRPGEPEPELIWVILTPSWEAACIRYHELQGWEPYIPMEIER